MKFLAVIAFFAAFCILVTPLWLLVDEYKVGHPGRIWPAIVVMLFVLAVIALLALSEKTSTLAVIVAVIAFIVLFGWDYVEANHYNIARTTCTVQLGQPCPPR